MKHNTPVSQLAVMAVILFAVPTFAKPKLNRKSATIQKGKTVNLKVKGAKNEKIRWSSSNKAVVSVKRKTSHTAVLKGVGTGKATIKARVGKKILKCQVVVKDTSKDSISPDAAGSAIVEFAMKFLGLRYVWGGTSLKNGADAPGFCVAVYQNFGIQLMRVADDQRKGPSEENQKLGYMMGIRIKDTDLMPGDLVFYCKAGNGVSDHVAIYIGSNKVIHEAGSRYGVITSDIEWVHGRQKNMNMRYWD